MVLVPPKKHFTSPLAIFRMKVSKAQENPEVISLNEPGKTYRRSIGLRASPYATLYPVAVEP